MHEKSRNVVYRYIYIYTSRLWDSILKDNIEGKGNAPYTHRIKYSMCMFSHILTPPLALDLVTHFSHLPQSLLLW